MKSDFFGEELIKRHIICRRYEMQLQWKTVEGGRDHYRESLMLHDGSMCERDKQVSVDLRMEEGWQPLQANAG